MAKENPNTKPKATTPFRKFEQLAKRLIAVPKTVVQHKKQNESPRRSTG
jgi:hypothetical protein